LGTQLPAKWIGNKKDYRGENIARSNTIERAVLFLDGRRKV
jgi:hypothetical protein